MSRFSRLEMGNRIGELGELNDGLLKELVKDETLYFAEANSEFEAGQFDNALRKFAKVLEFNPKNVQAWTGQVRALIELGEFREAKVWADKGLDSLGDDPELLAAKAVALARYGDTAAAMAFSDASMEQRGDTPYLWIARGDVLLAREEKHAEFCFQKALGMAPADWVLRWLASRVHSYYSRFSVALKYAEEALRMNTTNAAIWLQIGQCQLALGLTEPAQHSFTQAHQLDSRCQGAEAGLAAVAETGMWTRLSGAARRLFRI